LSQNNFRKCPGRPHPRKKAAYGFGRKIRLFKNAHDKIQLLKANSDMAKSIANIIDKMGKFRHLVFHSTQGFTDDQNIRNLRRMVSLDSKNMEERVNITAQQLAESSRLIVASFNPMTEYAKFLLATFPTANKQS
jgi:hypothetical protein